MREAAVMMVVKDGKILAVSRRNNKAKFGLAGGKVDSGETSGEAAVRETFEETGITVTDAIMFYRHVEPKESPDGEDFNTTCYYANEWYGEPSTKEEGEVVWFHPDDLMGERGAFPNYNFNAICAFKLRFPNVELLE